MAITAGRLPRHAAIGSPLRFAWPWAGRSAARASVRAELHLGPGERVLIRVRRSHNVGVVATDRALYWQPPAGAWMRLGWEAISELEQDRAGGLTVIGLAGGGARRTVLPLPGERRFLTLAQERIAATRIILTHVVIDGRALGVEGRRQPGSGRLHWFIRLPHGVDVQDPELPDKLDRAVAELQAVLGT